MEAEEVEEEDEEGEGTSQRRSRGSREVDDTGRGVALACCSVLLASMFESGVSEGVVALVGDDEVGASSSKVAMMLAMILAMEGEHDTSSDGKVMRTAMLLANRWIPIQK